MQQSGGGLRVGEILIRSGRLTWEELDHALEAQKAEPRPIGRILMAEGFIDVKDIFRALALQYQKMFWDFEEAPFDPSCSEYLAKETAYQLSAIPVARKESTLVVAYWHPEDADFLKKIEPHITGMTLHLVVASPDAIDQALARTYGPKDKE